MQGERGDAIAGPPVDPGVQGEQGRPGAVIDASGRDIITVKGEKVLNVTVKRSHFVTKCCRCFPARKSVCLI